MNEKDEILEEEPQLLSFGSSIGIYEAKGLLEEFGGLAIPAHIDRASYSLIGVMGLVDPEMGYTVYETTPGCDRQALMAQYQFSGGFLSNSDAHDLIAIADAKRQLEIPERSAPGVIAGVRTLGEQKIGV